VSESVTAHDVLAAIRRSHSKDLVVPECKNGPTMTGSHVRMDAWVLLSTWSPLTTVGYEIKVSRADWRRDNKLGQYQGLCHMLWVAAPKGVVPVEELPDGVGLKELCGSGDGARLVTKRKATRAEIQLPTQLMAYVLMSRVTVTSEASVESWGSATRHELERWASSKDSARSLHWALNRKIRDRFDHEHKIAEDAAHRAAQLEHIRDRIVEMGFDPTKPVQTWSVDARLRTIRATVTPAVLRLLQQAENQMVSVRQALADLAQLQEHP